MDLQKLKLASLLLAAACFAPKTASAQETAKQENTKAVEGAPTISKPQKANSTEGHRIGDKENRWLFAGVGAARTLDYFSTLNMRRRGRQEIFLTNDVADNHAAFAAIEAATTATSVGVSYLFHRSGHHRLERWTSFVHIGLATTGAVRNYCLKTAHQNTTP